MPLTEHDSHFDFAVSVVVREWARKELNEMCGQTQISYTSSPAALRTQNHARKSENTLLCLMKIRRHEIRRCFPTTYFT